MSMVVKLQPGLRTAISQYLDGQTGVAGRTEPGGNQQNSEFADSRECISFNIPSNGPSVRGSAPPVFVARQTIPAPPASPATVPSSAPARSRTSSNNPTAGVKSELFEKSEGNSSKKRKDSDLPNRNTTSWIENIPKTMSHDQAKRPRLDNRPGDVPTAADLGLKGKSYGNDMGGWRGPPLRLPSGRRNTPLNTAVMVSAAQKDLTLGTKTSIVRADHKITIGRADTKVSILTGHRPEQCARLRPILKG
ncbi:hypothetical protein FCULG_00001199 [Fusarium culmorum]|uniref:Uncharacterized protein n=1 Tax=Fusarium culmorum TaxID=5516 RepID=A0A2T4GP90_FUSCU|nr:hypothetical protein FCULG_00001199 [Fusarium culmorum]